MLAPTYFSWIGCRGAILYSDVLNLTLCFHHREVYFYNFDECFEASRNHSASDPDIYDDDDDDYCMESGRLWQFKNGYGSLQPERGVTNSRYPNRLI